MAEITFPVSIQINIINQQTGPIYYPQVIGLENKRIENSINQKIQQLVQYLIQQQHELQGANQFTEMIGTFEIKTNERNILSLSLANYAYAAGYAHGLNLMKSLTFNTKTGRQYQLSDLFKPNSNYVEVLSAEVSRQIKERNIQLVNSFTQISPNQDFYIADKTLVIYFQVYEITPGYVGFPMFPISVYSLTSIYDENGPLGIMATNN